jgi:carbon storage regulator
MTPVEAAGTAGLGLLLVGSHEPPYLPAYNDSSKAEGFTAMLVLSRKKNEQIVIGENIVITIVDVRGDKVRIGIEAPAHVPVHRHEVYLALQHDAQATSAAGNEAADQS